MIIKLKDFIATGKFGTIGLGSTKDEVIKQLGKPQDIYNGGEGQIMYYGWYEFHFWTHNETVFLIHNDHLQADCTNHAKFITFRNKKWSLDPWFLEVGKNITFADVTKHLKSEGIAYELVLPYPTATENILRCLPGRVCLDFVDEYNELEYDAKGKVKGWKEIKETDPSNSILYAMTFFEPEL